MARMNPIEKAEANPKSMRASVNAFCYICKEESKKAVKECPKTDCKLYNIRPWQPKVAE